MTDKEKLEQIRDKMGEPYYNGFHGQGPAFDEGFNTLIPLVIEMKEALENAEHNIKDMEAWMYADHGIVSTQPCGVRKEIKKVIESYNKFVGGNNEL